MNKMYIAVFTVLVAGSLALATPAIQAALPNSIVSPDKTYMPMQQESLFFDGVAVKDNNVVSAVFVATDRNEIIYDNQINGQINDLGFKNYYLLLDGKAYVLVLKDVSFDQKTRIVIATFSSEGKELKLVIKAHEINYYNSVFASGEFDGYLLNMKAVGNQFPIVKPFPVTVISPMPPEKPKMVEPLTEKIMDRTFQETSTPKAMIQK